MNSFRPQIRSAAIQTIAAFLIISVYASFNVVSALLAGPPIEVSSQWLPGLALFLLISFGLALLTQQLEAVDKIPLPPREEVSTRFKILGAVFLIVFTGSSMIIAALVFDNLWAIYDLLYGTMGLTLMCAMIYVGLASPLIPVWIVRQWIKVIRDLRAIKRQGRIERP